MRKVIASVLIAGSMAGGLALAAPANATPADDSYIRTLDHFNVSYKTHAGMITIAHGICDGLDDGITVSEMIATVDRAASGWNAADAGYIVGASVGAYCVWNKP